jgi:hypothetical protein
MVPARAKTNAMNAQLLSSVEEVITAQKVPNDGDLFAGAGLIVTDDPNCKYNEGDVLVLSPLARQISWVVYQMRSVFSDEIDYLNKLAFYPALGRSAISVSQSGKSDTEILMAVVSEAKNFWSNRLLS